jgi:hypothetical protein
MTKQKELREEFKLKFTELSPVYKMLWATNRDASPEAVLSWIEEALVQSQKETIERVREDTAFAFHDYLYKGSPFEGDIQIVREFLQSLEAQEEG